MGTELVRARIKEEDNDFPVVPPGFESFTSFKLIKEETTDVEASRTVPPCLPEQSVHLKKEPDRDDVRTRSLRLRPWINYGQYGENDYDQCGSAQSDQDTPMQTSLPRGVIRGCPECDDCQKVVARCQPEAACRPDLEEVPAFYPSKEEFEDTIAYIAKIRPQAEPYGICRIIPPASWRPPCPLREKSMWEIAKFATRVQRVDKLQNRDPARKLMKTPNHARKKRRRCLKMGTDCGVEGGNSLGPMELGFGFEPGPEFTLDAFQRYADDFKAQYFRDLVTDLDSTSMMTEKSEPSIKVIEGEYWRVVEKPTDGIEVLYGADLETGVFGSGFPKPSEEGRTSEDEQYVKSGWNLNKLPRLSGSVLTYENPDISGVQVPWLYVGMCFSSFCWHVEDHYLYSLNYMHFGAPKLWYGVPGKEATKLEEAMRKHLPDLFEEQPDLLHKLVTQLSPSILKSEGVPVYRCVQNPGEFVLTFPRAYHAGFNSGFNCAEAVNVAPLDWFPHGQNAVELYREQGRKTTVSHDKLLLGAAMEAVKANWELNLLRKNTMDNLKWRDVCGRDGILAKSLKARVDIERVRRDFLCNSSKALKMLSSFDATTERECSVCFFDLHLSAAACRCSPDRYACLNHAKQLCTCAWSDKFFLFRYDMNELDLLVEAIEGKLSAVYRWARSYLGFSLSSCISKDNIHVANLIGLLSSHSEETLPEEKVMQPPKQDSAGPPSLTPHISRKSSDCKFIDGAAVTGNRLRIKKEACKTSVLNFADEPQQASITTGRQELGGPMSGQDVICLSDDEGEHLDRTNSGSLKQRAQVGPRFDDKTGVCNPVLTPDAKPGGETCSAMPLDGEISIVSSASANLCRLAPATDGASSNEVARSDVVQAPSNSTFSAQLIGAPPGLQQISKIKDETCVQKIGGNVAEDACNHPGSPSCSQNSLDKYYRQKGPRIAKVVRRINCHVELLEHGAVVPGKLWSNSRAIFPKGFRSRVRYMNVLDPATMCHYISEVLDWGAKGPLFAVSRDHRSSWGLNGYNSLVFWGKGVVSLEHCCSEVFVHATPTRCWEMVRERVNQEISKLHKLGRLKLPPLQPHGSLDGYEMFGFTSTAIIQAVEALDKNRVCRDYWNSRPLAQASQCIQSEEKPNASHTALENTNLGGADVILKGLFKKANSEELHSLLGILREDKSGTGRDAVTRFLNEEVHERIGQ